MRCKICEPEGLKSNLYMRDLPSMLVESTVFFDENEQLHDHNPRVITRAFNCSRGHAYTETISFKCNVPGCDWTPQGEK